MVLSDAVLWALRFAFLLWGIAAGWVRAWQIRKHMTQRNGKGRLVVVGGGFAGAVVAKLAEHSFASVHLVDAKEYWEYTPSVPAVLRDVSHAPHIQLEHSTYLAPSTAVVLGHVREIDLASKSVLVDQDGATSKRVGFDQLVLCPGTGYATPFREGKGHTTAVVQASRAQRLLDAGKQILAARSILIIGGGIVGVELAAELVSEAREQPVSVTLVHSGGRLMSRSHGIPPRAQNHCLQWLRAHGVRVELNVRLIEKADGTYAGSDGSTHGADLVFLCTGIVPNTRFVPPSLLDARGYVVVDKYLRVPNTNGAVFAAGDCTAIDEEKLAQNAELHAHVVARNLLLGDSGNGQVYRVGPRIVVISLGPLDGCAYYAGWTVTGWLVGLLKRAIELKSMAEARHRQAV